MITSKTVLPFSLKAALALTVLEDAPEGPIKNYRMMVHRKLNQALMKFEFSMSDDNFRRHASEQSERACTNQFSHESLVTASTPERVPQNVQTYECHAFKRESMYATGSSSDVKRNRKREMGGIRLLTASFKLYVRFILERYQLLEVQSRESTLTDRPLASEFNVGQ